MRPVEPGRGNSQRAFTTQRRIDRLLTLALLTTTALGGCALVGPSDPPVKKHLSASPLSLSFGNVNVGNQAAQTITWTNTGNGNVTLSRVGVSGPGFSTGPFTVPWNLAPGQSVQMSVVFAPASAGSVTGSVTGSSDAINSPNIVAMSGTGVVATSQLSATPTSLSFGTVNVGSSSSQNVTLSNTGSSSVTISQVNVSGAGFSAGGLTLPLALAASQTASLSVTFAPTTAGSVTGSVSVVSNATNSPITIALSGTGFVPTFLLSASPASLSFGNVNVGSSSSQNVTLTNTGNSSVTISQMNVSGAGFSTSGLTLPLTLAASQTASLSVTFAPTAAGTVTGSVSVISNATNSPVTIALSGTGFVPTFLLSASPTSLSFGNVNVGSSSSQNVTLTNTGNGNVTLSQVGASGAGFSIGPFTVPQTLTPGQTTTVTVVFAPASGGSVTGSVSVVSNATNSPAVTLSGTGVVVTLQLSANPTSLSFGTVNVATSSSQNVILTNVGSSSVTISQVNISGAGFSASGLTLPLTLAASQTATLSVTFAPTAAGSVTGSVSVVSNATNSPITIALSGTGFVPTFLLSASPTSLSLGTVNVGSSSSQNVTLTNTGNSSVTISQVNVFGAGFSAGGLTLPLALAASQTASLSVTFAPTTAGSVTGSVSVVSNATNSPITIALSGTGFVPTFLLSASPTSLSLGTVNVGSSSSQNVTLTNTGNSSVTISQVNVSGAGFSASGLTLPLTLAASQTASLSVTFAPTAAGSVTGNVSVVSNATNSPITIALSGTGFVPTFLLSASPTSLSLGTVNVGSSSSQSVTLSNTGNSSVTISQVNVSGAGFSASGLALPLTLAASQTASLSVTFAPTAAGSVTGSVSVVSNATNSPTAVTLSGTGFVPTFLLSASPTSLSFGNVTVGSSSTQTVTLTNSGNSSVTISQVNVSGAGFSASGLTLPLTLTAGQSTALSVQFAPSAGGSVTGSVSVVSNATNSPVTVTLGGSGVVATFLLSASPTSLSFGNVLLGSSSTQTVTLTNSGNSSVTISQVNASGAGFTASGLSLPLTLAAGQGANFSVLFGPTVAGSVTGSVSVVSNATNSPAVITLSGSGVQPIAHSVTLSWTASTSVVVGYNVYRGTTSGGPYTKLNASLVSILSYIDSTVQSGQTYFYVATAVNSNNNESVFSNEAPAAIPIP